MVRLLPKARCALLSASLVVVVLAGCAGLGNRVDGTLVEVLHTDEPGTAAVDSDEIDTMDPPSVRGTNVAIRCDR